MLDVRRSRTDQARFDFVSGLMMYNSTGIGRAMAETYHDQAARMPTQPPSIADVAAVMEDHPAYKFGAFFERHNHAMMFDTALDILQRDGAKVDAWLDAINLPGSLGSVTLDPELPVPNYYKSINIHTQPGNYHGKYAGFLYHWMLGPFLVHRDDRDEMGWALARGVPQRPYERIVDLGCGIGKSTLPYCELYPDADVIGVDYAGAMLRYGHKLAEARGKSVSYLQRQAESTGIEANSVDLVVAIWLFHELPHRARDAVVREALRILKPGGVFAIMESPPFKALQNDYSPLSAFLLDSTGRRMDDPFIPEFFKQDRTEMFRDGGFTAVRDVPLPNELTGWGTGEAYFFGAYPWWMTIGEKPE